MHACLLSANRSDVVSFTSPDDMRASCLQCADGVVRAFEVRAHAIVEEAAT